VTERTLVRDGIVLTVDSAMTTYRDGAVLIEGDTILDVGPTARLADEYSFDRTVDASDRIVLPGFVDAHLHSGFIRGLAEDMPVFEWLTEHVDPTHEALTREEARVGYELCYAEMARAGVTTALDMYRFMDEAADVAVDYGVRVVLAPYVANAAGYDYFETLADNRRVVRERHGDGDDRVRVWFGLEHLTYCTEEAYYRVAEYAEEFDTGIHTHGEESREMAERLTAEHGMRPVELLHERGILGDKTVLAHCVWLTDEEIRLLAETNTGVAHCPASNMKLASGVAPVPELLAAGVPVGLGGDGIKENNRIDLIQEMKLAALLQKVDRLDATVMPAERVLRMATIEGARALGLADRIGSLEAGKRADLITVDAKTLHASPLLAGPDYDNVVANLVHAAQAADVRDVFVDGTAVVRDGEFLPADEAAIVDRHTRAARQLLARRDR
jgi:5-methylthioadenosine/S-adenosylhomocysteine deaminase